MNSADATRHDRLLIISGRSGSGKSTALHVLEDAGFYCIDNLPAGLLPNLFSLAHQQDAGTAPKRMAVSIDARNLPGELAQFPNVLAALPETVDVDIIYLDADDQSLIKRFSETRRRHPLSDTQTSLPEAIRREAILLEPIAAETSLTIDTSRLNLHDLRDLIMRSVLDNAQQTMTLRFQSFGFKRGVPADSDMVYDVRCLPNPHWVKHLRALTGRDEAVASFLQSHQEVRQMFDDIRQFLDRWLPQFKRNNRSYVTVAIGCTGGQHRSVYLAEQLYEHFQPHYPGAQLRHRELGI